AVRRAPRARARAIPGADAAARAVAGEPGVRVPPALPRAGEAAAARDADPAVASVPALRGPLCDPDPAVGLARRGRPRQAPGGRPDRADPSLAARGARRRRPGGRVPRPRVDRAVLD